MKNKKPLLKFGNKKLPRNIAVFNLPAGRAGDKKNGAGRCGTCAATCPGCYALKPEIQYLETRPARERNYKASLRADFVDRVTAELKKAGDKVTAVRIHESGDFYSVRYAAAWGAVAGRFPRLVFFAYTKRLHKPGPLADTVKVLGRLPNVIISDSLQYGGVNYGTREELKVKAPRAFLCPCGTAEDKARAARGLKTCGVTCHYCMTKAAAVKAPVFLKH